MQLLCTLTSPFARKVRMFALEKGVADRVELRLSNPLDDPEDLLRVNPLAKIPALLLDDGTPLYDSRVICEYLDSLADAPVMIPSSGDLRWAVMRRQALADGLMDAAVSVVFEHRRPPTEQSPHWLDRWDGKIRRAVATLDAEHARQPLELGRLDGIAAAAALAYLDFRLPELDWHDASPGLAAWWLETARCPCVVDTAPPA
ncbi:glutathione S-transferase N-terminal domain-containing protein [uncultured Abyssibacter sp.]|uniref:glutathione S-transferase N-terminal domain-containing protein n=1 Tax=uncultured Abyssibacter sp. TaxID=2320202 RepID=UPI0032B133B8